MTDDELKALVAQIAVAQAKTDTQLAKTDAKLSRLADLYGVVGNNQGRVAEEFYFNSLKTHPVLNGIHYDVVEKNVTRYSAQLEDEHDILLINGQEIFIIEVKYWVHPKDIDRLIDKKAVNFRKLFPEYANYRQHLGLATFSVDEELKQEALQRGVTVLQRCGNVIETLVA